MGLNLYVTFGEMVGIRRHRLRMSQTKLAERVGVSRNYISQIERGKGANVSFSVLQKLCHALDIDIQFIEQENK